MPRIARIVIPQYPHHITQRGNNKATIFHDDEDRYYFIHKLNEFALKTETNIWAYCLMDNHFHLLLEPTREQGLMKCLHGTTFQYAQYFNQKYNRNGRLWQNRYFSCPVDKDEYLWAVVRYIEKNPLKAKVIEKPEDWKWSSARFHIIGEQCKELVLHPWLSEDDRKKYRGFVESESSDDGIRTATKTGRPLGTIDFIERLESLLKRSLKQKKGGRPKKSK